MSRRKEPIHAPQWPAARRFQKHWAFWFFDETYRENIYLIWPVNGTQLRKFLGHQFGVPESQYTGSEKFGGRVTEILPDCSTQGNGAQVISLAGWDESADDAAVLAHETFHCVANLFSRRGVEFSNDRTSTNEHFAYMTQRVFGTCMKAIRSIPSSRKKPG